MRGFKAELSNGQVVFETDFINQSKSALFVFKDFLLHSRLKINSFSLIFDHETITTPNFAKTYFYLKRAEAGLNINVSSTPFYGIGSSEDGVRPLEVTWYDGDKIYNETRKIEKEDQGIIFN